MRSVLTAAGMRPAVTMPMELELPPETRSGRPRSLLALRRQLGQTPEIVVVRDDRPVAGEVDADAGDVDVVHDIDALEEGRQIRRQHAFAQVAELDHRHDGVTPPRGGGGVVERHHRLELALERDVGEQHGLAGELGRRRPQQPDRRREAGGAEPRGVLEARLSPSALAPPASSVRATCGEPQVTFVTATTSMPGR